MSVVHFLTHPEVVIDPDIPITAWPLSPHGLRRTHAAVAQPWIRTVRSVFCSLEQKAIDAAAVVAAHLHLTPIVVDELGENDRSATGYLPKAEFETVAVAFVAEHGVSVRGWERAIDAQRRIVAAVEHVIGLARGPGDIAILSHGGVGALLLCHLQGKPISRSADQPGDGGGNMFSFRAANRRLLSTWRRIEGDA